MLPADYQLLDAKAKEQRRINYIDDGSKEDAEALFDALRGDNPVEDLLKDGVRARRKDGQGCVTYRPVSSDEGPQLCIPVTKRGDIESLSLWRNHRPSHCVCYDKGRYRELKFVEE